MPYFLLNEYKPIGAVERAHSFSFLPKLISRPKSGNFAALKRMRTVTIAFDESIPLQSSSTESVSIPDLEDPERRRHSQFFCPAVHRRRVSPTGSLDLDADGAACRVDVASGSTPHPRRSGIRRRIQKKRRTSKLRLTIGSAKKTSMSNLRQSQSSAVARSMVVDLLVHKETPPTCPNCWTSRSTPTPL